jgi:hypothetical protein
MADPTVADHELVARLRATQDPACDRIAEILLLIYEEPETAMALASEVQEHVGGTLDPAQLTTEGLLASARSVARSLLKDRSGATSH